MFLLESAKPESAAHATAANMSFFIFFSPCAREVVFPWHADLDEWMGAFTQLMLNINQSV